MPSETLEMSWQNYINSFIERGAYLNNSPHTWYHASNTRNSDAIPRHGFSSDSIKNGDILISTRYPNAIRVSIMKNKKEYYFESSNIIALEQNNLIKVLI